MRGAKGLKLREEMGNHCPIHESTSLEKSVGFLEIFRIGRRYWWVPDRGSIDKKGNDKRAIQSEKKHTYRSYYR